MKIVCVATGKSTYGSVVRAEGAAALARSITGKPYRVYRCPSCGCWHLTTRPYRFGRLA